MTDENEFDGKEASPNVHLLLGLFRTMNVYSRRGLFKPLRVNHGMEMI